MIKKNVMPKNNKLCKQNFRPGIGYGEPFFSNGKNRNRESKSLYILYIPYTVRVREGAYLSYVNCSV